MLGQNIPGAPRMSGHQRGASPGGRAVPVIEVAPGEAAPALATELSATGKRGIPVLIAPLPLREARRRGQGGGGGGGAPDVEAAFEGFLIFQDEDDDDPAAQRKRWFKEMRGWLMVVATVAASVAYQAGMNPPGGFWQDDMDGPGGHAAGNPVLRDKSTARYKTFYYFNSTAFVTSLVITMLLMSERFYRSEAKVVTLMLTTIVDLASLVGAYIAGSTRFMSSCIYVIVITGVAFAAVICMGEVMGKICGFFLKSSPCMHELAARMWLPVPKEVVVVDSARRRQQQQQQQGEVQVMERVSQRKATAPGSKPPGCSCSGAAPTDGV